jgi:pantoate--beta-alanine ligase
MQTAKTITALRTQIKVWRQQNQTIGFVPTMGNLHQGHLSLVAKAQELADKVVVSVFVNPLQFNDKTDLSAYPRSLNEDIQQLASVNCDLLYIPTSEMMYPKGENVQTTISVPGMDDKLCGQDRPGHFDGVATIVNKLLNIVQADIAIFGEKDYQQLLLIKIMVEDLNLPIEIIGSPTYREPSGLAMSSRNHYLTDQQREQAAELYQTLLTVKVQLEQGELSFNIIQQQAIEHLHDLGFSPDYVDIRRADNLEQAKLGDKSLRVLLAARLGQARLIDNIACNLA